MTENDNNTVDIEDVNLDDFTKEFFQLNKEEVTEKEDVKDVDENEEDQSLATEDDDEDADVEGDEEDEDDDEEIVEVPQPKQKRNRAQERIERLVTEARQAERERDALRIELERIRSETKEVKQEEETPFTTAALDADAPKHDALDKDGNPVYELGEFDPKFIRDLTKYTIAQETKVAKEAAAREEAQKQILMAQEEIKTKWNDNLNKAESEIPEIRENIRSLVEVFQDVEPSYGEYLASTLMFSDYGPQIMNYFSQNIGEAKKIVALGPSAATLALGRLEAKFATNNTSTEQEEKRNTKQVSKAAPPPEDRARGLHGRFAVAPDTDDLNAFERAFFQK